ncbi:MAG TPA: hypothetical protein PK095_05975 [Myxococcota bacterium]|nr:hypothetical protein [Myxococcota bacterium]
MRPIDRVSGAISREPDLESSSTRGDVRKAAVEFEAVMLRQMVEALKKATKVGGEEESGQQMTDHLIEDALANHLAKAGGIGLAETIASSVEERHSLPRTDMHLVLERGLRFTPLPPEVPIADPAEPPADATAPENPPRLPDLF